MNNIVLSTYTWALTLRSTAPNAIRNVAQAIKAEDGQDLMEYAILVGGIAAVAGLAIFAFIGTDLFTNFAGVIQGCIQFDAGTCQP